MSYDNLSSVSQNVLKCYQQFTIFTFAIPELLDLIWRKNRMFTLCCMITWVVFLRMFWNFISTLPVKRGGSLSFLVGTISNVLVMEIGWTDVGSGGYILVSCAHSNTSLKTGLFPSIMHVNAHLYIPVNNLLYICYLYCSVSCAKCCLNLWIVHPPLPHRFSLTFIWIPDMWVKRVEHTIILNLTIMKSDICFSSF